MAVRAFLIHCWAVPLAVILLGHDLNLPRSLAAGAESIPRDGDEFVGPFPSWRNLKLAYGARGDGSADDTDALQRALDDIGASGGWPVLYVPAGTYRITRTLTLASKIYISLVGQDPTTTTLVWDGIAGGTMLWSNGVAYSRFTRLTFDGRRRASIAIEQSWENRHPHFDTGNEYSDVAFIDVDYGIYGGFRGHGFAETSIRRAHFIRNTRAGVAHGNFNALDTWIWQSTFDQCGIGVTNGGGAGNFHVYNSIFRGSLTSDLFVGNTGGFSARGNYSAGSKAFFTSASGTNNPATITLQSNVIVDPIESTVIRFGNQGPGLLLDNVVRSAAGAIGPIVSWISFIDSDVTSVGNTFTVARPVVSNGRLTAIGDRVVRRTAIKPAEPKPSRALPNLERRTIEVRAGGDGFDIQNAIIAAARYRGSRPLVHVPFGSYSIKETLTLPVGDLQLVGDGGATILRWTGTGTGPVLRLLGPTRATLRELTIDGAGRADGVIVENTDQSGARVYMDQAQLRAARVTNLFVNGLDNAYIQLEDIGYAYSPEAISIKVIGGPAARAGKSRNGKTIIHSGASAGNRVSVEVTDGAKVLVRDLWYESGAGPGFAKIHGRATFTLDGARISSPADQLPAAFDIRDLHGRVSILTSDLDDRVEITGNGTAAHILGLGIVREQRRSDYFLEKASPAARAVLLNSRHLSSAPGNRSEPTPNTGDTDAAWISRMLDQTRRERPELLRLVPNGATDVRMFRVWVTNGRNNITLNR